MAAKLSTGVTWTSNQPINKQTCEFLECVYCVYVYACMGVCMDGCMRICVFNETLQEPQKEHK